MSRYSFRRFREEDFPALMNLERNAFPLDAYTPKKLRKRISTYPEGFWVALLEDNLVGYIAAWIIEGVARIDSMAVAQEHRKCGVGSRLLVMALEHFKKEGFREVELELRPSNEAAIRLYESFDFEVACVKPGYYEADNGDALLMKRRTKG